MIYFLKKLSSIEQNYDIYDKKLLIIITILKTWKMYAKKLLKFIIFTNHKNLLYFINTKKFNKRQMKWSKIFKQYKFTIRYTSKKNDKINALNKQNNYMKNKKTMNHNIFKINDDKSLLINVQKMNTTLKIFNNE